MPSSLHEYLARQIDGDILGQIRGLKRSSDATTAKLAHEIGSLSSARLKFRVPDQNYDKHEPDASFRRRGSKFPGLVIEISWSQRRLNLPRLAREYIRKSDGLIRTVVGIDVGYRNAASATLSVWRAEFGHSNGEETINAAKVAINQVKYP
jgi:hypothetical protein